MKKILLIIGLIMGIIIPSLAQSPLCASYPTSFCCEYVSEVNINGAVRTGPTGYSPAENAGFTGVNGYYDYTGSILTSMVAGNTYPVSVTVKTNSTYQEFVKIWFDFNGNGSLSDAGELMFDQVNNFDGTYVYSGNVTVPTTAFNGDIYIRVVMVFANIPALCGSYAYGTTLDFKANISGGVTSRNLSVAANGTGGYSGSVTSSPAGINTDLGFNSANYNDGSVVNLTAAPSGGSVFIGWSGDATGTTNPLAVTMNAAKSITANFGPPATTPSITTNEVSSIGTTTSISGGDVYSSTTPVSERGVCWNTLGSPSISDSKTSDGTGTGEFTSSISGLSPGTTYYLRAYATNSSGTAYGNEVSFTTIKNSQTITFNNLSNPIYGDDEIDLLATSSSGLACSYISSNTNVAIIDGNEVEIIGAGTTQITAIQGGNAIYYPASSVSQNLVVGKKPLIVSAGNESRIYGDPNPSFSISYSGFVSGENENVLTTLAVPNCTADLVSDAGSYSIIPSGADDENYSFSYNSGVLTINKAILTLAANDASMIYGDNLPQLTYSIAGFKNNDDVSVLANTPTMTCFEGPLSNAGSYPIYIDNNSTTNYDFGYLHGTLTINKATLDVSAQNAIKIYGETNPNLNLLFAGFKNNEDFSVIDFMPASTVSADEYSNVGTYPISINGGLDNNYEFNYFDGELTINKALLTVTADNLTKVYGEPDLALTYSYSGFVNGENSGALNSEPSISCPLNDMGNAGIYQIELSGGIADNYDFNLINGIYTILKAPLFVSTDNATKTYGEISPIFSLYFNGFIGTENLSNLSVVPSVSCMATEFSSAGIYPIELTGGIDENYDFIYQNGELSINKANLYVAVMDTSRYFNTPNPEFVITYMGFVNNEDVNVLTSLPIATTTATQTSVPGIYPIELNGGLDENYNFNYGNGNLTILFSVNIETHENISVSIYPNPTRNYVNITNLKNCEIKMMDIAGKLIYTKSSCNGNQKINVSTLPAGIYMIELKGDNINKTQKLVVN
ncbi:MAG: T9SS type A sorting domain-containing protein [Bacteroidetes bacterium]|nr:T9SS type A sorting domain-containing protein [Bacteroidota bacterium]